MGQRRLARPQGDDLSKRPDTQKRAKSNNTVLNQTTTRKGEVFRAQRRTTAVSYTHLAVYKRQVHG